MADAFVYDAVRTPRGKGKSDGSLHEVTALSRDDVDAYAVESQKRSKASWDAGNFKNSVIPVKDVNGITILAKDEHMRPTTTMQSLAQLAPSFVQMGEMYGFDAVAIQAHPDVESVMHVHHAGNSSGIVDGAAAVLIGTK